MGVKVSDNQSARNLVSYVLGLLEEPKDWKLVSSELDTHVHKKSKVRLTPDQIYVKGFVIERVSLPPELNADLIKRQVYLWANYAANPEDNVALPQRPSIEEQVEDRACKSRDVFVLLAILAFKVAKLVGRCIMGGIRLICKIASRSHS